MTVSFLFLPVNYSRQALKSLNLRDYGTNLVGNKEGSRGKVREEEIEVETEQH